MRTLPLPKTTASEAITLCIESIRDTGLAQRLSQVVPTLVDAEAEYLRHGPQASLYLIAGTSAIAGVSSVEMELVYKGTFVKSKRTRQIYDAIKSAPRNKICPLCAQRTVSTLDHYLPQAHHSALVVTPMNLVPACRECNTLKLARRATNAGEQTLHPYFDDIDSDRWLFAEVLETTPASLRFYSAPPPAWPGVLGERIDAHFRTFKLGELYSAHAGSELSDLRFDLERLAKCAPERIPLSLMETAASCAAANRNSWRRVTYEAFARSTWFCGGGFSAV